MTWNKKLQTILDYVEHHLQRIEQPVDPEEIAKLAECSYSFFQKVFSYMNGISFAEYIRYRKLTLAGYALKSTSNRILDISYQFGYDSPTSFTKAFQQFHKISPKDARNSDVKLRIFPKMKLDSQSSYQWQLRHLPSFRLIGKSKKITCHEKQHVVQIPQFWQECKQSEMFIQLAQLDDMKPKGMFGLIKSFSTETEEVDYLIGVGSNQPCPATWDEVILPSVTWAIFDCTGPAQQAVQQGWRFLHEEWLVQYPFAHANCPELEWYSEGNSEDKDYLSQIWIPIIEKE